MKKEINLYNNQSSQSFMMEENIVETLKNMKNKNELNLSFLFVLSQSVEFFDNIHTLIINQKSDFQDNQTHEDYINTFIEAGIIDNPLKLTIDENNNISFKYLTDLFSHNFKSQNNISIHSKNFLKKYPNLFVQSLTDFFDELNSHPFNSVYLSYLEPHKEISIIEARQYRDSRFKSLFDISFKEHPLVSLLKLIDEPILIHKFIESNPDDILPILSTSTAFDSYIINFKLNNSENINFSNLNPNEIKDIINTMIGSNKFHNLIDTAQKNPKQVTNEYISESIYNKLRDFHSSKENQKQLFNIINSLNISLEDFILKMRSNDKRTKEDILCDFNFVDNFFSSFNDTKEFLQKSFSKNSNFLNFLPHETLRFLIQKFDIDLKDTSLDILISYKSIYSKEVFFKDVEELLPYGLNFDNSTLFIKYSLRDASAAEKRKVIASLNSVDRKYNIIYNNPNVVSSIYDHFNSSFFPNKLKENPDLSFILNKNKQYPWVSYYFSKINNTDFRNTDFYRTLKILDNKIESIKVPQSIFFEIYQSYNIPVSLDKTIKIINDGYMLKSLNNVSGYKNQKNLLNYVLSFPFNNQEHRSYDDFHELGQIINLIDKHNSLYSQTIELNEDGFNALSYLTLSKDYTNKSDHTKDLSNHNFMAITNLFHKIYPLLGADYVVKNITTNNDVEEIKLLDLVKNLSMDKINPLLKDAIEITNTSQHISESIELNSANTRRRKI